MRHSRDLGKRVWLPTSFRLRGDHELVGVLDDATRNVPGRVSARLRSSEAANKSAAPTAADPQAGPQYTAPDDSTRCGVLQLYRRHHRSSLAFLG